MRGLRSSFLRSSLSAGVDENTMGVATWTGFPSARRAPSSSRPTPAAATVSELAQGAVSKGPVPSSARRREREWRALAEGKGPEMEARWAGGAGGCSL